MRGSLESTSVDKRTTTFVIESNERGHFTFSTTLRNEEPWECRKEVGFVHRGTVQSFFARTILICFPRNTTFGQRPREGRGGCDQRPFLKNSNPLRKIKLARI